MLKKQKIISLLQSQERKNINMKKEDSDAEAYSLVKAPNWSVCTDTKLLNNLKGKSRNDLICSKHKNNKLSLLIHEIEGFVIEESNLPFKVMKDYFLIDLFHIFDMTSSNHS